MLVSDCLKSLTVTITCSFSCYSKEYCIWFITYNCYFTIGNTSTEFYFELFMFQNTHSIA
nr:MAG TPA: hypothetical protein [Bacteriophage sp.]